MGAEEEVPEWLANLAYGDPRKKGRKCFPPTYRVKLEGTWIGHDMSWMAVGALRVAVISLASQVAAAEASLRGAAVSRLLRGIGAHVGILVATGMPHQARGYTASETAFLSGLRSVLADFGAVFHNGTPDPRAARGRGVAIVTNSLQLPVREIRRGSRGRAMAGTVECGRADAEGVSMGSVRLLACYPPTGGTSRDARSTPAFATEEDGVADFILEEHFKGAGAGVPVISGWDANAIHCRDLDSIGTAAEPREESALNRALSEGEAEDTWRRLHPELRAITRRSGDGDGYDADGGGNRLGYILCSPGWLRPQASGILVRPPLRTDHDVVVSDLMGVCLVEEMAARGERAVRWRVFLARGTREKKMPPVERSAEDSLIALADRASQRWQQAAEASAQQLVAIRDGARSSPDERSRLRSEPTRITLDEECDRFIKTAVQIMEDVSGRAGNPKRQAPERQVHNVWWSLRSVSVDVKAAWHTLVTVNRTGGRTGGLRDKVRGLGAKLAEGYRKARDGRDLPEIPLAPAPGKGAAWPEWERWWHDFKQQVWDASPSVDAQARQEGRKDWQAFIGEAQTARRKFLWDGDLGSFYRWVFPQGGGPVAYAPVLLADEGSHRVPRSPEDRMRAADAEMADSISTNRWVASSAVPPFLRRWKDDLGHERASVDLSATTSEEEVALASAFSGTPVGSVAEAETPARSGWGAGLAWGDLLGPISTEERAVLLSMQPSKAPGLSGMKMAAVQYLPIWMQDWCITLLEATIIK